MKNVINHVDKKYGSLTVLSQWVDKKYKLMGFCKCDCGKEKVIRISHLVDGAIVSCGCHSINRIKKLNLSHGRSKQSIHNIWKSMRQRCLNPNNPAYKNYGARGIKICDDWSHSFESFFGDMGDRPSAKHSIDRINNDGNYEPSNCRWATPNQQAQNRRKHKTHKKHKDARVIECFGETKIISEWANLYGLTASLIGKRIKRGWPLEDAITKPRVR